MGLGILVCLGVVIHLILLVSIFDIYFTSPIIRGLTPVVNKVPPLCKRLVIFSIDGLRLDALLEDDNEGKPIAPYIRWSMAHRGTWGISHTHLPTESRPGHVAMLSGFYEDPSAVTKGWKENPVDFDSIFNRSICSFSWGSPDIVNIFYKDLQHDCIYKFTYKDNQDFSGNTLDLDNWVYNHVTDFFSGSGNPEKYSKDGSLFFLHLLGQDTSGHTHKPKTERYRENLQNVDRLVKAVDKLFEKMFSDNATAFVLTADHGMTDWGSHGAGDPSETLTPIVTWGKGIRNRNSTETNPLEINQADITPLLAILLGVSIPVNSIGILPQSFLNLSYAASAQAHLLNAEQVFAQYRTKRQQVEAQLSWFKYKSYSGPDSSDVLAEIEQSRNNVKSGQFHTAHERSKAILQSSLDGIHFYQKYFQTPLFVLSTSSYLFWIMYLLVMLESKKPYKPESLRIYYISLPSLSIAAGWLVFHEGCPITYHFYVQLPIFLFTFLIHQKTSIIEYFSSMTSFRQATRLLLLLLGIELFVMGFHERRIWSLVLFAIIVWPFYKIKSINLSLFLVWLISGVLLAGFTVLPVVGKLPHPLLNLFASISFAFATGYHAFTTDSRKVAGYIRASLILAAGSNSYVVHSTFGERASLNYVNQYFSWVLFTLSLCLLFKSEANIITKGFDAFTLLAIPFILLSISHEVFFLLSLFVNLSCWIQIELTCSDVVIGSISYQQYTRPKLHGNILDFSDYRRAYFFLAYIFIAFFGIGNLASLNSFDPTWVRCFLTSFSPFIMTILILIKVLVPFLAVSIAFRILTLMLNITPYKIFILVLIYSNIMGINFLFLVKNEGSWLEIGTSLSHYVIQHVAVVFLMVLYFVSQLLVPDPLVRRNKSHFF